MTVIFAPNDKQQTEPEVIQKRLYSERRAQRLMLQTLFIFRRLLGQYWARGGVISTKDATIALMGELSKINHEPDHVNFELIAMLQQRAQEETEMIDKQQEYHFNLYEDWWEALKKEKKKDADE